MVEWLRENPTRRLCMFSDSTQTAQEEGRLKVTGKDKKVTYYSEIAEQVFLNSAEAAAVHEDFAKNPGKYAKAVENFIGLYVSSSF